MATNWACKAKVGKNDEISENDRAHFERTGNGSRPKIDMCVLLLLQVPARLDPVSLRTSFVAGWRQAGGGTGSGVTTKSELRK